jgi:hypothetical protein
MFPLKDARLPSSSRIFFKKTAQQRSLAIAASFQKWRRASARLNMATPSKVHLTVNDTGIVKFKPQTAETAAKTSELLQENHDVHLSVLKPIRQLMLTHNQKYHIFSGNEGFHNHIVHHILTLYGLGASAEIIEQRYKENTKSKRPRLSSERAVEDLSKLENFKKCLGKGEYYHDFLLFWQSEFEKKGWENVLNEYMFSGDERGDDLLGRFYAGMSHSPYLQ